jgi:hypothetical protein
MIYFLVNNNYQLYDARQHLPALTGMDVSLIRIPHTLTDDETETTGFHKTLTYRRFIGWRSGLFGWFQLFMTGVRLNREIRPGPEDTLFFYTEFEPANHMVVVCFKAVGAKVYMIEDGGFGTYVPFRIKEAQPLSFFDHAKQLYLKSLPGLGGSVFRKLNGIVFPWVDDAQIDAVCFYRPVKIVRRLPVMLIRRPAPPQFTGNPSCVLFLNEDIYRFYQSEEAYLRGLRQIMAGLEQGFNTIYFKFHPRETEAWRQRITDEVLVKMPRIRVITENAPIEDMIEKFCPGVIASYFSTALLNLREMGIEPLYLYHLIEELAGQPVFLETTEILKSWGYRFVADFSAVGSGYVSGLDAVAANPAGLPLRDLVAGMKVK